MSAASIASSASSVARSKPNFRTRFARFTCALFTRLPTAQLTIWPKRGAVVAARREDRSLFLTCSFLNSANSLGCSLQKLLQSLSTRGDTGIRFPSINPANWIRSSKERALTSIAIPSLLHLRPQFVNPGECPARSGKRSGRGVPAPPRILLARNLAPSLKGYSATTRQLEQRGQPGPPSTRSIRPVN